MATTGLAVGLSHRRSRPRVEPCLRVSTRLTRVYWGKMRSYPPFGLWSPLASTFTKHPIVP